MNVLWQKGYKIYPGQRKDVIVQLRRDGALVVTCTFSVDTPDDDIASMVTEWGSKHNIPDKEIPAIIQQVKEERDSWKMPQSG